jgi:hypothetical protein
MTYKVSVSRKKLISWDYDERWLQTYLRSHGYRVSAELGVISQRDNHSHHPRPRQHPSELLVHLADPTCSSTFQDLPASLRRLATC